MVVMATHWTEKLFIEEPDLFRLTIEARFDKTQNEVEGLIVLLKKHGVPESGLILDLACGIGRVSIPLAKKGYNVTGIDISPPYIKKAIKYAEKEGVSDKTRFVVGDMRKVTKFLSEYTDRFDAVVNMWTSMGYWDEETDLNILNQSLSLTKPTGIFIMHTANRDGIVKRFQARDLSTGENGLVILMERELDLETSRMINYWTYYRRKGKDLHYLNRIEINHRVYSLHELKKQFQVAGWKYLASYGGFDQRPLTTETFSMIIVSQRQ
jgi:SAM-dependent methyltransferase